MNIRILLLLFVFLFINKSFVFCEEVLFQVIKDAPVWYSGTFPLTKENSAMILEKGELVNGIDLFKTLVEDKEYFMTIIFYGNERYLVQADMLVPSVTTSLFDDFWITTSDNESNAYWICDYYLCVLLSENRDTFYEFEYEVIDSWNSTKESDMHLNEEWYELYNIDSCLEINQVIIYTGGFSKKKLFITNITSIHNGYKVSVFEPRFGETGYAPNHSHTIPFPTDKPSFNLLLIRDNDYLDMYLDTTENRLATFVKVNKDIVDTLNTLLESNTCDLSKITSWPRRADGSMDYPPPLNMSNYVATHRTLDNLRLRDTAGTSAKLVTTLPKGTEVQVIETGPATTVDGISAPWVRVTGGNGYTGWCFSGYLEEIKKPDIVNSVIESQGPDIGVAGVNQGNELILHDNKHRFMPLWALIAIIGGAVVLAGGVVLFIVKRKKTN